MDRKGAIAVPIEYQIVGRFQAVLLLNIDLLQNELVIPSVFQTKMYGLFVNIDGEAITWRKSKKFASYLEEYKVSKAWREALFYHFFT